MGLLGCSCWGLLAGQVRIGLILVKLRLIVRRPRYPYLYSKGGMGFCLYWLGFLWGCWILFGEGIIGGRLLVL